MKHLPLIFVVLVLVLSSAHGIDFGLSKISETFAAGASEAAKVSGSASSAIASIPDKVSGSSDNETTTVATPSSTGRDSSTSEPTSSSSSRDSSTPEPTSNSRDSSASESSSTSIKSTTGQTSTTTISSEENAMKSNSTNEGEEDTTSSSWVPEIVKKPIDAVVSAPGKLTSAAGDAWQTVSETVVNQDPAHSVKFYFYDDPKNLTKYKQIVVGQPDTLASIRIAPESRLNVLIHGFMQDYNSSFPQEMKDALLMHIGGPVVCVDWGHMADGKFGPEAIRTLLYPFIVDNVATVGEYVGDFVVFLKNNSVISSYDQVHIIGFSLGGHVSGIAGWKVQNSTNGEKIGRITGLDPAGPKFFLKTQERKLNQDDAKFVDVIHTSHLGYFLSLGHIDFFPNGGKLQPGCVETDEGITEAVASLGSLLTGSCSHARAWEYYTKSIKDNELYGCECNNIFKYEITGCEAECKDKMPFGEPTPNSGRGAYYLSI